MRELLVSTPNLSKLREQNRFQERPAFLDEMQTSQPYERPVGVVTPEKHEELDEKLEKLGALFSEAQWPWRLEGALNISLMTGSFVRDYKDIDIELDEKDLEEWEQYFFTKGYGFFLSKSGKDPSKKIMQWATAEECREDPHLMLVAIDHAGNIKNDESLNFIDVHIAHRDAQGYPRGYRNAPLPKEWFEPRPVVYAGQTINLSHPAKVAYYKLRELRTLDVVDLRIFVERGGLMSEDLESLEHVFSLEQNRDRKLISGIISCAIPELQAWSGEESLIDALSRIDEIKELGLNETEIKRIVDFLLAQKDQSKEALESALLLAIEMQNRRRNEIFAELTKMAQKRD